MSRSAEALMIAAAVGMLLATSGCAGDDMGNDKTNDLATTKEPIRCQGINECKGHSECASPKGENACQGQNECKGMGWVTVASEKACTDQGGMIITA